MRIPPVKIYFSEKDKEQVLERISEVLSTGQLTLGKYTREFENEFASYVGKKYAIAVNSGTSALEISLRIFHVTDKEVVVPTNTFFATASSVLHAGGKVTCADVDPQTFSIDLNDLKRRISSQTTGVIIVHIGGIISPQIEKMSTFCKEKGLFVLEDAAHAHGSVFNEKIAGALGDAGCFSFFATKVMTSGEGGMIVTDSEEFARKAKSYRDQGKISPAQNLHDKLGYNWRMSEVNAIIGVSQLSHLDEFINERRKIAEIYDEELKSIPKIKPLLIPGEGKCNYYKYIAMLDRSVDRRRLKSVLREKYEVSLAGEVYELPCHLQPIFGDGYRKGDFPEAEYICAHHICLPVYVGMKEEEANYVVNSLEEVLKSS